MPHPEHAVDAALGPVGGRPLLEGLLALPAPRGHARQRLTGETTVDRARTAEPRQRLTGGATRSNESSISSSIIVGARLPSSVTVIQWRLFMW